MIACAVFLAPIATDRPCPLSSGPFFEFLLQPLRLTIWRHAIMSFKTLQNPLTIILSLSWSKGVHHPPFTADPVFAVPFKKFWKVASQPTLFMDARVGTCWEYFHRVLCQFWMIFDSSGQPKGHRLDRTVACYPFARSCSNQKVRFVTKDHPNRQLQSIFGFASHHRCLAFASHLKMASSAKRLSLREAALRAAWSARAPYHVALKK